MTSKVESIMAALKTKLTVPPMTSIPAASVYRDLNVALESELPALALLEGNESEPDNYATSRVKRSLNFSLTFLFKGTAPFSAADAAIVEAYALIMADTTLGGLTFDIKEGQTVRELTTLEKPVGVITKHFAAHFITSETSLTS